MAARRDLRSGQVVARRVDIGGLELEDWVAALDAVSRAHDGPFSAPAPAFLFEAGAASKLDALLRGARFKIGEITIEIDEAALKAAGPAGLVALERLRAGGWGLALACRGDNVMPMGGRLRGVLTGILVDAPSELSPAMALSEPACPLMSRVRAARNAGLAVTALNIKSPAQAGLLIALGFDRGEY